VYRVEIPAVKRNLYVYWSDSDNWSVYLSESVIVPVLKSVARKRIVEIVTD
jgi:hypothetical protein